MEYICVTGVSHARSDIMLYQKADNGKLSGRADGNVYMRNGVVRGMKVPSLVRNDATGAARAGLSGFSGAWNSLNALERGSWNSATGNFRSNRFGVPVEIKGKALFVKFNQQLLYAGQSQQDAYLPGVIPPSPLTHLGSAAAAGAATMTLGFDANPVPASTYMILFATAQFSAGTYRPSQSAYRYIKTLVPTDTTGMSIYTEYTTKFGALVAGTKIFLRAYMVSDPSGKASAVQDGSTIVAA